MIRILWSKSMKTGEMRLVIAKENVGKSIFMHPEKPHFVMLVGLPAVGKTTYAMENYKHYRRISSDDFIDAYALQEGRTYNEVFQEYIDTAQKMCFEKFLESLADEEDIVLDRTSLSMKARTKILRDVPGFYRKTAVYLHCSDEKEHLNRLNNRPGKNIPDHVMSAMKRSYQPILPGEGFDEYIEIDTRTVKSEKPFYWGS
jgi:predicted kinase